MERYPTPDRSSSPPAPVAESPAPVASQPASVSAGIAAANALLPKVSEPGPRFPGEDSGRSLAEMAHRDLDAALQLLAERAQYITGAGGAAIALRRDRRNDMICRASAGVIAPELGALLSMEHGLSGESVRTRLPLRCDDTESDPRVNREVCRELGIASVVVMPVVSGEQVLGVFELLSAKPGAFDQRDVTALQRLGEMVDTLVKYAAVAPPVPVVPEPSKAATPAPAIAGAVPSQPAVHIKAPDPVVAPDPVPTPPAAELPPPAPQPPLQQTEPAPDPKKPQFWSAAPPAQSIPPATAEAPESLSVPPVLRNFKKCATCGFPISSGRTLCVECEDKQFRGQSLPKPAAAPSQPAASNATQHSPAFLASKGVTAVPAPTEKPATAVAGVTHDAAEPATPADEPDLFLSAAAPSPSWFATNKYIFGALLVVAIVVAVIVWLR